MPLNTSESTQTSLYVWQRVLPHLELVAKEEHLASVHILRELMDEILESLLERQPEQEHGLH